MSLFIVSEYLHIKEVLLMTEVCGPMSTVSVNDYYYYLTFIDDFSRCTWIYIMKTLDEVLNWFKEFKSLMEKHT